MDANDMLRGFIADFLNPDIDMFATRRKWNNTPELFKTINANKHALDLFGMSCHSAEGKLEHGQRMTGNGLWIAKNMSPHSRSFFIYPDDSISV
jgi:hypothetical protein